MTSFVPKAPEFLGYAGKASSCVVNDPIPIR